MRIVEPFQAAVSTLSAGSAPLNAHLVFMGSDPLLLRLVVEPESPDAVTWLLSRELLEQAVEAVPGALVGVPGADSVFIRDNDAVKVALSNGRENATLFVPLRNLKRILGEVKGKYHLGDVTVNAAVDGFLAALFPETSGR